MLVVINNHLAVAHVVHFAADNLAFHSLVALEQLARVMLLNLLHQGLAKGQNEATAQVNNFDFFRNLFADFKVRFDLNGFGQRDL